MFNELQKKELLALAREAIGSHFDHHRIVLPSEADFAVLRGLFVTLHKGAELRGCIGYIKGFKPLARSVVELAQAAAFNDPRFAPLEQQDLSKVTLEISVLGELIPLKKSEMPEIGRDGRYIIHPYGSGLLLPQVAVEWHWDAGTFLREVCRKAGLKPHAYKDPDAVVYRFTAEIFSETGTF